MSREELVAALASGGRVAEAIDSGGAADVLERWARLSTSLAQA